MKTPLLSLMLAAALVGAGCASQAKAPPPRQAVIWTAPAGDTAYKTPEDASRAYETVKMMAGSRQFRYAGNARWEILENDQVVRTVVVGGQATDIDWSN